jgi:hypothetical protein
MYKLHDLQPAAPVRENLPQLSAIQIGPNGDVFITCLPKSVPLPSYTPMHPQYIMCFNLQRAFSAIDHYTTHKDWPL